MNLLFSRRGRMGAAAALLAAAIATAQAATGLPRTDAPQPVTIAVRPVPAAAGTTVGVTVRVPAGGRTATDLALSRGWANASGFQQGVRNLRVVSPGARLIDLRGAADDEFVRYRIEHDRTGEIVYAYDLVEYGEPRLDHARFYQPLLRPDYAFFFGYAAWILPAWAPGQEVRVQWQFDLPAGWSIATSFGAEPAQLQARSIKWAPQVVDQSALRHSVHAFGDFRLERVDIRGQPVWLALRGAYPFADAVFIERTAALIRAQRAFFGDHDFRHTLVTLMPNDVPQGSTGGTQIFNAFSMNVSRDFAIPSAPFEFLVAHENLHTWLPSRFGSMDSAPDANDEPLRYWFSEGFTNFLTHRLLVQTGQWSLADYAAALNRSIRQYETSAARRRDNAAVLALFFKDRAVGDLPYQRGELLALHWDAQLRERGTSLAAVLKALVQPRLKRTPKDWPPLATERLLQDLERRLGSGPRDDVLRLVERGEAMPYREALLGPCFSMQPAEYRRFELGFDIAPSIKERRLVGLVPGSAAATAGLREGDALKGWSIYHGDTERDAMLQVEREGKVVDVTWRPVAADSVAAARFEPKPQAETDPACRRWMALQ